MITVVRPVLTEEDIIEVDIFAPIQKPRDESPIKKEIRPVFESLDIFYEKFVNLENSLNDLMNLFRVVREGDLLESSYKVTFNEDKGPSTDKVSQGIWQSFVKRYSLDVSELSRELRVIKDMLEAKLLRGEKPYCEVDIFENKKPVEC